MKTIRERKERWIRAMAGEPAPRRLLMVRYEPDAPPWISPLSRNIGRRTERAWSQYEKAMRRLEWLDDDSIPWLNCLSGTEIFAEAFGCAVHEPENGMPFALPMVDNAGDAGKVEMPPLDVPPLQRMFKMADELVRRAGPGALVRPPDIQSPMDIAALIWDKTEFCCALVETPEAVKELAFKIRQLLTAFLDEWFRRYGREFIAHHPDYYMPYGITLSEDEIGIVNTEMFDEFFLPELVFLSEHFGQIGIHCCADSRHQWDGLKKIPNLRFLNLKRELHEEAYRFFGNTTIIQQHGQSTEAEWDRVIRDNPEARLFIDVTAANRDEALRLAGKYSGE